jgi:flavin reductase (DIM6/NTAB) family NADH-FMN oxidoreductase RutF
MIAIAADHYAQRLLQPNAKFVINTLKEGRSIRRHFSHQPKPGETPFKHVAHRPAANGCLILEAALAYLECTVQSWIPCGDHWLIYAIVQAGEVLDDHGSTAIQQRKSGSQH